MSILLLLLACDGAPAPQASAPHGPPAAGTTWYPDLDGDSWGDDAGAEIAQDRPCGYQPIGGDCDDGEAAVHPGAVETCDGIDEDCDGAVDNDPVDLRTWWPDADGDGYGDAAAEASGCTQPSGTLPTTGEADCDDARSEVSPAGTEICGNGLDDDCDGKAQACGLEGTIDLSTDPSLLTIEQESAFIGDSILAPGDLDGDGIGDLVVGAYGVETDGISYKGAAYLLRGPLSAGGSPADLAGAEIHTDTESGFGGVAAAADLNGDGFTDLAFGQNAGSYHHQNGGLLEVFDGPFTGGTRLRSAADAVLEGQAKDAQLGLTLTGGEDLDGDGLADLLVSAKNYGIGKCADYLVAGPVTGTGIVNDLATSAFLTDGLITPNYQLASPGDLDGDGQADVALLAQGPLGVDPPSYSVGGILVFFGPIAPGEVLTTSADRILIGGWTDGDIDGLFGAGDVDGDGLVDMVATSSDTDLRYEDAGVAWVWTDWSFTDVPTTADAPITLYGPYGSYEIVQGAGGDIDGDGLGDLFLAGTSATEALRGFLGFYLPSPIEEGTHSVEELAQARFEQAVPGHGGFSGGFWEAAMSGDVTGDGQADLVFGQRYADFDGTSSGGAWFFTPGSP